MCLCRAMDAWLLAVRWEVRSQVLPYIELKHVETTRRCHPVCFFSILLTAVQLFFFRLQAWVLRKQQAFGHQLQEMVFGKWRAQWRQDRRAAALQRLALFPHKRGETTKVTQNWLVLCHITWFSHQPAVSLPN